MNTPILKPSERLKVVDSLRGFALLAIVLLHNLEHYNLYFIPDFYPEWLQSIDKFFWDMIFFLFAGKAYATFSLLFGFSFYIQFSNARKKGIDFRGRFAWRMFLLFLFSQFHALFYNGDILLLYAVVGLVLIPVCKLSDKNVLVIAVFLLLQPYEWGRLLYTAFNPDYAITNRYVPYAILSGQVTSQGTFWGVLCSNIWTGQLYSNIWQVEAGRLFQTAGLFMLGMLLGRRRYFEKSDVSCRVWHRILKSGIVMFIPLYCLRIFVPDYIENSSGKIPYTIIIQSLSNFVFMAILISAFTLLWFKKESGYKWQNFIIPYGRMSLTNYITQSIIGVAIYYGYGLCLYRSTGAVATLLIGAAIFIFQLLFSRWWLSKHKQGPFEYLWRKATWIGHKRI